ncbi:MAG: hypothetical protein L6Q54_06055 [Leptospiraceae bacterium]|nr:hypothetical protein [Leptospiraceae bacterium]MCK6380799.1 hypothetical protein [Leptospiraceae bacterium]NUM42160.1 hypothetical protein [Leptospiraceae bacterium]
MNKKHSIQSSSKLISIEEVEFIEKCGVIYEKKIGLPRIAGKIIGFLLISDPLEQNLSEIQKTLKVSKASVSNMMRIIEKVGFIEKITLPGERTAFYRMASLNEEFLRSSVDDNREFRKLMEVGLKVVKKKQSHLQLRIKEWHSFYKFAEEKFPSLFRQWLKKRKASLKI